MKKVVVSILVGLGCLLIMFGGVIAYIFYNAKTAEQIVATNVAVSSEWFEITPDSAMKPKKQVQEVVFVIDGYKSDFSDKTFQIKLPDGTIVNPDVQILDEFGNVYELKHSGFLNNDINYTPKNSLGFLEDRNYSKIRIRSDKPFQISKVIWRNANLK